MEQSMPPVNNITEQTEMNSGSKHSSVKILLFSVIILALFGVIGYAYYTNKSQITLGKVVVNTLDAVRDSKIKSAEFSASVNADVNFSDVDKQSEELNLFPSGGLNGVKLSISWDGILDNTEQEGIEAYGKVNLNIKIDAPSGSPVASMLNGDPLIAELEYYVFPDSVYFKINKVPSIVDAYTSTSGVKLSSYLNRWFILNETEINIFKKAFWEGFNDAAKRDNMDFGGKNPFAFNLSDENYSKLRLAILKYLDQSGAIIISDRKSETIADGQKITALYTKVDKDKYLSASKSFSEDLKEIFSEIFSNINPEKVSDNINNSPFMTASDTNIKFFVGSDGYFHGEEGSIYIKATGNIPSVSEKVYLSLKNYNKSFKLQKPVNAQTFIEVIMEMQSFQPKKYK